MVEPVCNRNICSANITSNSGSSRIRICIKPLHLMVSQTECMILIWWLSLNHYCLLLLNNRIGLLRIEYLLLSLRITISRHWLLNISRHWLLHWLLTIHRLLTESGHRLLSWLNILYWLLSRLTIRIWLLTRNLLIRLAVSRILWLHFFYKLLIILKYV